MCQFCPPIAYVRLPMSNTCVLQEFSAIFIFMKNKKLFIVGIAISVVLIGFIAWYIRHDLKLAKNNLPQGKTQEVSQPKQTATVENSTNIENQPPSAEDVKIRMPDLDKEIVVNNKNISEEEKNRIIKNIKDIIAVLKGDYDRREDWLNLGIWRKNLGDYEGAEEAWKFVTFIRLNDPVAFNNLGDLYSQYLIDFSKAEKNYLKAIAIAPSQAFFYVKMHEFYRYFVKKPDLALNILEKGVKATGDASLKEMIEQYRLEMSQ